MRAEGAERYRKRGGERPEDEKQLQAGFLLVFFFRRCERFLP